MRPLASALPLGGNDLKGKRRHHDLELARQAAEFKATKKISYADCFAAALAKLCKAELVTGDKEFKQVEGDVKVLWI